MQSSAPKRLPLFGPPRAWRTEEWTASDDRVRGGSSQSYLEPSSDLTKATFRGHLDTQTLGGAGFASQRTTSTDKTWDASPYDGIELILARGDGKRYTLVIKTDLPAKRPDGRDESTVSYEYTFLAHDSKEEQVIFIPWDAFKPYYRGKPKGDAANLDLKAIKRWSFMCRSFFAEQEGDFEIVIKTVQAVLNSSKRSSVDPIRICGGSLCSMM
ncbi:hypothetical protein YB2330_004078 [Saitoella coloradoensis]